MTENMPRSTANVHGIFFELLDLLIWERRRRRRRSTNLMRVKTVTDQIPMVDSMNQVGWTQTPQLKMVMVHALNLKLDLNLYLHQTCHSIEMKNLDLTNKKSGSGEKNRDNGPIGYKKK